MQLFGVTFFIAALKHTCNWLVAEQVRAQPLYLGSGRSSAVPVSGRQLQVGTGAGPEVCWVALDAANRTPGCGDPLVPFLLCLPGGHHSAERWLRWELNCTECQVLGN